MTAKKTENANQAIDTKNLEAFLNSYLKAYHESVSKRGMDPLHLPQFFKSYPLSADAYLLPNGALCATFSKSSRSKVSVTEGENEDVLNRLKAQDFDFFQAFPPFTTFTAAEASRLAKLDADRDVKASRRLEMLTAAESHLSEMHTDIQSIVDLNPWLDMQTAGQKAKLEDARKLITELYSEVEVSREERFSDYMRQVSEVLAVEGAEMEAVAGEVEMEMESALQEANGRMDSLEEQVRSVQRDSEELFTILKDVNQRIKGIEKSSPEGADDERLEELETQVKDTGKKMASLQKLVEGAMREKENFQEIKETVLRDSKRTFNLNERITELERSLANANKASSKVSKSEIKALEGKLNVLESSLKEYVKRYVRSEIEDSKPSQTVTVERLEPGAEDIPRGATVRKTTRTTTKKKRVQ